ncbi:MAG TPA: aminopeptidase N [Nakamurella sp.]|nr:aminopeptidase N [Nakamurella sp.]
MSLTPNLTREQAAERAALLTVHSYRIEVDLTDGAGRPGEKTFSTCSEISFAARPGASTYVDFVGDGIASATLNGAELDVSAWSSRAGLPLTGLEAENLLVVRAVGLYTNTGEGLHRFIDPVDGAVYVYSQFETADAKRLYPCFDQPDLKATFTVEVTAPADWHVISNGARESLEDAPGGGKLHSFVTTAPMSTYVTALVAGPYHQVSDHHDGIDLGIYCRATLADYLDADRLFAETKQGFDFYHAAFGVRYPFGKYDQLFVPEFNAGAMENAGAVTFREEYVFRSRVTRYLYERRCETILHEMAHMWFGDLVTMRWWDDLWLNESFATWASVLAQTAATEYTSAWTTFANVEKSWAYNQDQLPSTHPIAADMVDLEAVEVNFDGITYAKGASVLKQLAAYVGLEQFLAGLRSYFAEYAYGNATLADLMRHLAVASGRDLDAWTAAWLQTTGINRLAPDFTVADDGTFASFAIEQHGAAPGAGELRPHRLAVGIYDSQGATGPLLRTHRVELDVTGARTEVPELVGVPRGALVLINDDDLTYCKMQLDPQSLRTAVDRVGDIAESLPRTLVWSAVWEMTRDAAMRARDFIRMALRGIDAEDEIGVVQRVLAQVHQAVGAYAEPGWASEVGWPLLADRLIELARAAEPGGDKQLAYVASLAAARLNADQLAVLGGWRDGSAPLPGLVVDTDLSWTLLGALVAHGAAGPAEIADAAKADATASGERRAMQVTALRPEPEAKQAIWDRLIGDDGMANALQDAAISGFVHPAQGEVLAAFVQPFFEQVAGVWSRRSVEVAQKVAVGLYPRWAIAPSTVQAAQAWALADHPPALRRLIGEGMSSTERALAARAADAG